MISLRRMKKKRMSELEPGVIIRLKIRQTGLLRLSVMALRHLVIVSGEMYLMTRSRTMDIYMPMWLGPVSFIFSDGPDLPLC